MSATKPYYPRLFFALWPDEALGRQLTKLNRHIPVASGKPVAPQNLHITLQFIGTVSAQQYQQLLPLAACCPLPAFTLQLDRLGYFPRPQVLWLGARNPPEALGQLVQCLGAAMKQCGLTPDPRPYKPHLTLRRKVSKPVPDFPFDAISWPVASFALVSSQTLASGAQYQILQRW